ncbi:MAG TPA: Crp/Fnr family transcriptional regulator [Chthoniobacterales bacterium]|nr:Crp/Fnr family transcriptional regulator [Chthoniobacterales bacterium]
MTTTKDKAPADGTETVRLIERNRLLASLSDADRQRLAASSKQHWTEKDEAVFREGEEANSVWLVSSGMVKLVRIARLQVALTLELVLPDELLGGVFYTDEPRYPCAAIAMEQTQLLVFPTRLLHQLLQGNPELARSLLAMVCRGLCHAQQMRGVGTEDVARRVAKALLYLHDRFGPEIRQGRALVAELAGTSTESAIRVTRALAVRGIVSTGRSRITVVSLRELQRFSQRAPAL